MSEWDTQSEPHVSADDLRAALAPRGGRRNPVLVSEHSDEAADEVAELRAELASCKVDLRERRSALDRLAGAGAFRRRRVLRDLRSRGLV